MLDGSPALLPLHTKRTSQARTTIETLVFGERAGGRSYWALDVTAPDPATWKVNGRSRWRKRGTDSRELGLHLEQNPTSPS